MSLSVIAYGVARFEYHASQIGMPAGFGADQEKSGAGAVFFQEGQNLRGGSWVRSVVNGQPRRFRSGEVLCQDVSKSL